MMQAQTIAILKKCLIMALIFIYLIFAVWWLAAPKMVLVTFVQRGATESVCRDSNATNDEICRSLVLLVQFSAVYYFMIAGVLIALFYLAYHMYPGNLVANDAISFALTACILPFIISSCLYINASIYSSRYGTTPFFPHWCVILANFPFAALACYVLAQEWLLRKNNKSHDAEINTEVVASAL